MLDQERVSLEVSSHAFEEQLFLAKRVTLGRSVIRFTELIVACAPREWVGGRGCAHDRPSVCGCAWFGLASVAPVRIVQVRSQLRGTVTDKK